MSRRVQSAPAFFGVFLCAGAVVYGCSSTEEPFAPNTGTGQGGSTSATGTGGGYPYATGGYRPATNTYVVPGGGASSTGTKTGTVAGTSVGGATGVSTVVGTGGVGTTTTTGVTATGGVVATTTTAANPNTGKTVTFKAGKATGAMSGYAYVALGSLDKVTSPTCGAAEITNAIPCASGTTWAADTTLCVTGSIPALPASPVDADYKANWGLSIGINATDPATGGLNQAHSSIAFTFTGAPAGATLQAQVQVGASTYCYDGLVPASAAVTSGIAIPLTSFRTACYGTTGAALTAASVPNIDKIALQVTSAKTAITVTSLCISGITFQ